MLVSANGTPKGVKKMASYFVRDAMLYLKYFVNGKAVRKSTKLYDTPENRTIIENEVLPKLEAKLLLGQFEENKPKVEKFEYYLDEYLESKEHLKSYFNILQRSKDVQAFFDKMQIDKIRRSDVKRFAKELLKKNHSKTVRDKLTILTGILDVAIDEEIITHNVCHNLKIPHDKSQRDEPFKSEDIPIILETIEEEWFRNFVAIAFYTGMRTGEIVGLMVNDLDFERGVIKVQRNVVNGIVTSPKTANSVREIPMFDILRPYLQSQMSLHKQLYLFVNEKGEHYYGAEVISRKRWAKVLDKVNLPYRKLYTARHTFITAMLKSGELSIIEIAQIVGHANSQMILRNYARFIEGEQLKIRRDFDPFVSSTQFGTQ